MLITQDLAAIEKMFADKNLKNANRRATGKFLQRSQPYVPLRGGGLRSAGKVTDHETIQWSGLPYGKAQFYGTNGIVTFKNYTTPGTGKRWDLVTAGNHMQEIEQEYVRGLGL
ncbi:minor capsid protein [Marinilactibacillus sp. Marseille-P9653]|uniref:minor capsid protein n=1 Tax=Marinilactibacillus sp. Marseille-P9653 TaxID=2866583 RepID=UPI001CE3F1D4|nr:minor capsid protein [Marinilactibacillus sp. Marseille-P9653]